MLRYLYWKDPTNPLLQHFEQTLLIRPLQGKYLDMLHQPITPLTDAVCRDHNHALSITNSRSAVKQHRVQSSRRRDANSIIGYRGWSHFQDQLAHLLKGAVRWHELVQCPRCRWLSLGLHAHKSRALEWLRYWRVLLRHYSRGSAAEGTISNARLWTNRVQIEEIFRMAKSKWHDAVGMTKTANTVTILSRIDWHHPEKSFVNMQFILRYFMPSINLINRQVISMCARQHLHQLTLEWQSRALRQTQL